MHVASIKSSLWRKESSPCLEAMTTLESASFQAWLPGTTQFLFIWVWTEKKCSVLQCFLEKDLLKILELTSDICDLKPGQILRDLSEKGHKAPISTIKHLPIFRLKPTPLRKYLCAILSESGMTWDLGPHHLPDILLCPDDTQKSLLKCTFGSHLSAPLILLLRSMLLSVRPAPTVQPFKSLSRQSPIVTSSIFKLEFGWLTTHTSKHLYQWMWEHSVMTKAFCGEDGMRIPGVTRRGSSRGWMPGRLVDQMAWATPLALRGIWGYVVVVVIDGAFTCMPTLRERL